MNEQILRIDEVMRENGINGTELSEMVGISQPAISDIVKNKSFPRPQLLMDIAEKLNVDIRELFKPTKKDMLFNGFVEYKNELYRIHNTHDLEYLLDLINNDSQ